ncbi:hypothetical protein, partial [Niallia circulans]|uniref:hypothetical protein n=1 Tax=Niallia circulans TaxID=1397 RepID=UPI0026ED106A
GISQSEEEISQSEEGISQSEWGISQSEEEISQTEEYQPNHLIPASTPYHQKTTKIKELLSKEQLPDLISNHSTVFPRKSS